MIPFFHLFSSLLSPLRRGLGDRDGGVMGWGVGLQCIGNGRAVSVVWIMISPFSFSLVKPVHGWGLGFLANHFRFFHPLLSSSFTIVRNGIIPNFYFRFLSHSPSPVLYISCGDWEGELLGRLSFFLLHFLLSPSFSLFASTFPYYCH